MSEESAHFDAAAAGLWVPDEAITWNQARGGQQSITAVEGGPVTARGRIVIQVPPRPWPAGSVSLIWENQRVRGFDLAGPPHTDTRGRAIPTPHRQWFDDQGRQRVDPVDLESEGIRNLEQAVRWFAAWCEITWSAVWTDPPSQSPLQLPRRR